MELKLVNENKLQVALTLEDMMNFGITCSEMDYDNTNTKRVFWDILDKAKRQTGFDVSKEQITIKVQDNKNEGCLIIVTKKSDPYTYEKKYRKTLYSSSKRKRLLYVFESSENLVTACKQLMNINFDAKSDIYADEEKYYLYLEDTRDIQNIDFLSEYGFLVNHPMLAFYLDEHAKTIVQNDGVKVFANLYNKNNNIIIEDKDKEREKEKIEESKLIKV